MKVKEFEAFVTNNARMPLTEKNYVYSFVGLAGETGEVMEWLKKNKLRSTNPQFTEDDLKNELGDVLHYVARICYHHGWTLKGVMKANVDKLSKRYGVSQ